MSEGPERHLDAARQKLPRDNVCRSFATQLPHNAGAVLKRAKKSSLVGDQRTRRGGGKKGGGTSRGDPPRQTVPNPLTSVRFQTFGMFSNFCPPNPLSISLSRSLRNSQNFHQPTSSETAFGGSRKMVSDGPSSQGFAFQYVLPLPLALPWGRGNLGGILRDNLGEGNCASKIAAREWGVNFCREASRCLAGPSGQVSRFSGTEKQPKHKVFGPVVPWTSGRISGRTSRSKNFHSITWSAGKLSFLCGRR